MFSVITLDCLILYFTSVATVRKLLLARENENYKAKREELKNEDMK
jgi:hypothetical protein